MTRSRLALALLAAALGAACADTAPTATAPARAASASAPAATAPAATMRFGRLPMTGLHHMAPSAGERSHAGMPMDKVYPHKVVIDRGQSVAFESFPIHQIAVYGPGTQPTDIRLDAEHLDDVATPFGVFPDVIINDPANRLAVSPLSFETLTWTPDAATFARPGRYLVICTLIFHFLPAKMYGWVEVR